MTTTERNKIAGIIKIYCQEQRLIDKATAATKKEASLHGIDHTSTPLEHNMLSGVFFYPFDRRKTPPCR